MKCLFTCENSVAHFEKNVINSFMTGLGWVAHAEQQWDNR